MLRATLVLAVLGWGCGLGLALGWVQAPPTPPPNPMAARVQTQLNQLQTSLVALDPSHWHASEAEKLAFTDSQTSIQRNLAEAVPGLLTAFRTTPTDLATAFRLYRDLQAVQQLAMSSSEASAQHADPELAEPLTQSVAALKATVDQLGNYIEAEAGLQYTALRRVPKHPMTAAKTPPPTMVIENANGLPTSAKAKPKAIPHQP